MAAIVVLSSRLSASGCGPGRGPARIGPVAPSSESRTEADRRAIEASHHRYAADIRQAHRLAQNGQGPKALELLRKYRPAPGEEDIREFAWYYLMRLCQEEQRTSRGHKGAVYHAGFSPDGRTLVSCGRTARCGSGTSPRAGRSARSLPPDQAGEVNWAEFSADGRTLGHGR